MVTELGTKGGFLTSSMKSIFEKLWRALFMMPQESV